MPVKVRFAPSPTGLLQVGNARIALVNWLYARRHGGRFLLRFDDTDAERSTGEYVRAIEEDLAWLGLDWHETAFQSRRLERYAAAAERLRQAGRLYPCYETEAELAAKREAQLARGRPPVYDRAALALDEAERRRLEAEGRRPHWRFRLEAGAVGWDDLVRGATRIEAGSLSDPVLLRADGRPLYTLCSVVDDLELGVSHVIRGEDHVANTAVQLQVFAALAATPPAFAHLPLLTTITGTPLRKRKGKDSVRTIERLRAEGIEPGAVNTVLATLGTADGVAAPPRLTERVPRGLVEAFDLSRFGRAPAKFDDVELRNLTAKMLLFACYDEVRKRLEAMGLDRADERFWHAAKWNITRLDDVREWYDVCHGPVTPVIVEPELTARAAALLPDGAWDETTWPRWVERLEAATGRRGKALFRPLRLALTGREHGPELKNLLPIIGRARARARLRGETA